MPESIEAAVIDFVHRYDRMLSRQDTQVPKSMYKEIRTAEFWRSVAAEFIATLLFVFLLCGSAIVWGDKQDMPDSTNVHIALTAGLAIASLVQCFGHISGGHINPSVSMAMMVTRHISIVRCVFYIIAQCVGAIAGAGILYGITPTCRRGFGLNSINPVLNEGQAFGIEFILTFTFVFTVYATVDPGRKELGSSSLAIGLVILVTHLTGLNYTGCGINPARSFGPALVASGWNDQWNNSTKCGTNSAGSSDPIFFPSSWNGHWVYWVGPLLGGPLAGIIYEYVLNPTRKIKGLKEHLETIGAEKENETKESNLRPSRHPLQIPIIGVSVK